MTTIRIKDAYSKIGVVKDPVDFHCPFCNLRATAAIDAETGDGEVLHMLPMCETFTALDPTEYLEAVRKRLQS